MNKIFTQKEINKIINQSPELNNILNEQVRNLKSIDMNELVIVEPLGINKYDLMFYLIEYYTKLGRVDKKPIDLIDPLDWKDWVQTIIFMLLGIAHKGIFLPDVIELINEFNNILNKYVTIVIAKE